MKGKEKFKISKEQLLTTNAYQAQKIKDLEEEFKAQDEKEELIKKVLFLLTRRTHDNTHSDSTKEVFSTKIGNMHSMNFGSIRWEMDRDIINQVDWISVVQYKPPEEEIYKTTTEVSPLSWE